MKRYMKIFFAAAVLFAAAVVASAVPARPGAFKYTQPDGTVIELKLHGDEFFHWTTRASDGQVMELSQDGFYRPGKIDIAKREAGRRMRRKVNEMRSASVTPRTHNQDPMTHGQRHIPVLLVQFSDLSFKIDDPVNSFGNLLNQQGYKGIDNKATGSVRDYYYDNSHGAFEPLFDVYGPVTLSKTMSYYGQDGNDGEGDLGYAAYAVAEAAKLLDNEIDFSNYDYDNDGKVDMILMYYAGYNQAEGASAQTIWPHQWNVDAMTRVSLDGKRLSRYFCTSELSGFSGKNICGIGTTCHEFGHSLGLPDFYDTDYEENGECGALYEFSIMCAGSYVNGSRTPPYFNTEERICLGWLMDSDVPELPDGNISLSSIKDDYSYKSYTDMQGEYFLYECRDGSGWDAKIPTGLVVYHVDKSFRKVGNMTAYRQWSECTSYNSINAYGSHPCFYVVPAYDQSSLLFTKGSKYAVFPGSGSVKTYSPVDWDGIPTGVNLTNIAYTNGTVTFTAATTASRTVCGYVKDRNGNGLSGVTITVSEPKPSTGAPSLRVVTRGQTPLTATSDSKGYYTIDLESYEAETAHVAAYLAGYTLSSKDVSIGQRGARVDFVLYEENNGDAEWISYFDDSGDYYAFGQYSVTCAMRIPAEELAQFAGRQIDAVSYVLNCSSVTDLYVIADAGGTRLMNYKVSKPAFNQFATIDLSSAGLIVPEGKDLYIGLAINGADNQSPLVIAPGSGNTYYASYGLSAVSAWSQLGGYDFAFAAHIAEDSSHQEELLSKLSQAGFNLIYPGSSYVHSAGEEFQLRIIESAGENKPTSVEWLYDGNAVSGTSVKLTKGTHRITAKLVLANGRKEVLDLDVTAQ